MNAKELRDIIADAIDIYPFQSEDAVSTVCSMGCQGYVDKPASPGCIVQLENGRRFLIEVTEIDKR